MSVFRRLSLASLTACSLLVSATVPATVGSAADLIPLFGTENDIDQSPMASPLQPDAVAERTTDPDASELECMAKVVLHEAANQPYEGRVAVAQTLVNRVAAHRFGGSVCEVVNQRGQFFNTAAYNPSRGSAGWTSAMQVARTVLAGGGEQIAPGAMFFCSNARPASGFFRSRRQVASIGGHVFYR